MGRVATELTQKETVTVLLMPFVPYITALSSRLSETYRIERQDGIQEGMLAACKALHHYDGRASVKTFLTRSIINHFLNLKRKRDVPEDVEIIQLDMYDTDSDSVAELTEFASVDSPEIALEQLELMEIFLAKLMDLEEDVQQIISMRINGDKSFAEIANVLKVPIVNVRVKMHRAVMALRKDLLGN